MKLTIIGCSGSFPGPDSPASCYLVEADDADGRTWRLLLDFGNGALGVLQRHASPYAIDAVLITHLHADHFLDLCGLYVALRYNPDGPPARRTPVYGPAGIADRLDAAYGAEPGAGPRGVYDYHEWAEASAVTIGPFTVTPRRVDHPVEAYGLRVEHAGPEGVRVLAYSGDTDECPALVKLAEGADVLLAEAAFVEGRDEARHVHLTGLRAGRTAADAGVRRLLLTHIPVWTDADGALAEARSAFDGATEVVKPGAVYEI